MTAIFAPLRLGLALFLLLLPGLATAAFFFDRDIEYIDVNLDEVSNNFNRSITVNFKTVCEFSGCNPVGRGQDYRLGVSSQDEGEGRGKPQLGNSGLSGFLKRVRFQSDTGRKYTIYNNGWSNWSQLFYAPELIARDRVVTFFELGLKKRGLKNLKPGEYKSVYIIGLDDELINYHDTLEIRIHKKESRTTRISNLKDVSLTQGTAGNYEARSMSFCVYVSDGGKYLLRANGVHTDYNNQFNLSQGNPEESTIRWRPVSGYHYLDGYSVVNGSRIINAGVVPGNGKAGNQRENFWVSSNSPSKRPYCINPLPLAAPSGKGISQLSPA